MVIEAGAKVRSYRFNCIIPYGDNNGKQEEIGCSEIGGLDQGIEESTVKSGRIQTRDQSNPDKINHLEVELRRGIDKNERLWNWWQFTKSVAGSYGKVLQNNNKNFKRTITVKTDYRIYNLYYAYPISYSLSDLDATNSGILFEEVSLKVQDINRNLI